MAEEIPKNAQVADSIDAAVGVTGFSRAFLQWLKDNGSPGFRGSRVYCDEVIAYVEENELGSKESELDELDKLNVDIQREKLRKIRFQNDVEQGRYIARETIGPRIYDIATEIKATLQRELEVELPLRIEGRSANEIRPEMRRLVDKLCATFAKNTRDLTA